MSRRSRRVEHGLAEFSRLLRLMGFDSWRPNDKRSFEFSAGGRTWRGQILWGAEIDHADHVHVGIARI